MRTSVLRLHTSVTLALLGSATALAQNNNDAANNAAGAACCGSVLLIPIAIVGFIVLNIALLVWVARDAKSRGMDSAVAWMALVFFTGPLGLVIYIFSRPQGNVIQCPNCHNKKLEAALKCPHCGFGA
jgi:uncharacterized membrane protein YhaH (DUF805 family)